MVFNGVLTWMRFVPAVAAVATLVGSVWYAHSVGRSSGAAEVQARWTQEQLLTAQATAKLLAEARAKESELNDKITQLNLRARNETNRIRAEHDALVDSLRNRPEARAGDPGVPEGARAGVGCTGAGLSQPDALFLGRLAADAARTQAALDQCVGQYEAVKKAQP